MKSLYSILLLFLLIVGALQGHTQGDRVSLYNHDTYLLKGPVREMRVETAGFTLDFMTFEWIQQNRHLSSDYNFNADGLLMEKKTYSQTGQLSNQTSFEHQNGFTIKETELDAQGNVIQIHEYEYNSQGHFSEERVLSADGELIERYEFIYSGDTATINHYDANDVLLDWIEINRNNSTVETITYDGDGSFQGRTVTIRNENQTETIVYDENNAFVNRFIQYFNEEQLLLKTETYEEDGTLMQTTNYLYEDYDPYGNWQKRTMSITLESEDAEIPEIPEIPGMDMDQMPVHVEYRIFSYTETGVLDYLNYE